MQWNATREHRIGAGWIDGPLSGNICTTLHSPSISSVVMRPRERERQREWEREKERRGIERASEHVCMRMRYAWRRQSASAIRL